jgi:ferric-dicitrate binding protein FerR (iron transport regulator)
MNRQEQRALRAIEKSLSDDDPALAELLRPPEYRRRPWIHRSAAVLAVVFMLLAAVLGDVVLMLIAGLFAAGAAIAWAVPAFLSDERDRSWRRAR